MKMTDALWQQIVHFKKTEAKLASPDAPSSYNMIESEAMFALDALRGKMARPMKINSGYRTPAHNKAVGGAPRSQHLDGNAFDVSTTGWTKDERRKLIVTARELGFRGVGIADTFIHIDMAPRTAAWIYIGHGQKTVPLADELKYA